MKARWSVVPVFIFHTSASVWIASMKSALTCSLHTVIQATICKSKDCCTSQLTFQSAGVATFFVAVNCSESITRKISLQIKERNLKLILLQVIFSLFSPTRLLVCILLITGILEGMQRRTNRQLVPMILNNKNTRIFLLIFELKARRHKITNNSAQVLKYT